MGDLPQLQGLKPSWKWLKIAMSRYYKSPLLEAWGHNIPPEPIHSPNLALGPHLLLLFLLLYPIHWVTQDDRTRLGKTPHNQTVCLKRDPHFPIAPHSLLLLQEKPLLGLPPWRETWSSVGGLLTLEGSRNPQQECRMSKPVLDFIIKWNSVMFLWC